MSDALNQDFGLPPVAETPEQTIARLTAELAAKDAALAAAKAPTPDEPVQDLDSQGFKREYVKLRIFQGSRKDDIQRVPLGIGGYVVQVERGPEVVIHKQFAMVLQDAVEDITISGENELITQPAHRFPFQIIGPATEAEYLAFRAKTAVQPASALARV